MVICMITRDIFLSLTSKWQQLDHGSIFVVVENSCHQCICNLIHILVYQWSFEHYHLELNPSQAIGNTVLFLQTLCFIFLPIWIKITGIFFSSLQNGNSLIWGEPSWWRNLKLGIWDSGIVGMKLLSHRDKLLFDPHHQTIARITTSANATIQLFDNLSCRLKLSAYLSTVMFHLIDHTLF